MTTFLKPICSLLFTLNLLHVAVQSSEENIKKDSKSLIKIEPWEYANVPVYPQENMKKEEVLVPSSSKKIVYDPISQKFTGEFFDIAHTTFRWLENHYADKHSVVQDKILHLAEQEVSNPDLQKKTQEKAFVYWKNKERKFEIRRNLLAEMNFFLQQLFKFEIYHPGSFQIITEKDEKSKLNELYLPKKIVCQLNYLDSKKDFLPPLLKEINLDKTRSDFNKVLNYFYVFVKEMQPEFKDARERQALYLQNLVLNYAKCCDLNPISLDRNLHRECERYFEDVIRRKHYRIKHKVKPLAKFYIALGETLEEFQKERKNL